jgi:hypothetical protein
MSPWPPGDSAAAMRSDDLPAGLPPGRLVAPSRDYNPTWTGEPVYWASDRPLPDAPKHWARLRAIHDHTGLWPLLIEYPDDALWPRDLTEVDAFDAEALLVQEWRDFVRLRGEVIANPPSILEVPRRSRHTRGSRPAVRVVAWPGTAWPLWARRCRCSHGRGPEGHLRHGDPTGAHRARPGHQQRGHPSAAGLAGLDQPDRGHTAVGGASLWQERFGAQVVGFGHATLYLSVSAPPTTRQHAEQVALEHFLTCPDNVYQVAWTFPGYVDRVLRADLWRLWWD